ncbi:MAG: hypothetical protein GQ574_11885 [Crocinitomix sp.]|nr:hypothetical protein [Crocinitomix sp.]
MLKKIVLNILGKGASELALRKQTYKKVNSIVNTDRSEPLLPNTLDNYVEKVARNAYKVLDEDIAALKTAGFSEDEIFELTVTAALSAGAARVELASNLLD